MGSPNGGIIGVINQASFGKCTVTTKTSSAPSAVTTQPGTRLIKTLIVAGGGGGSFDQTGAGGAGGLRNLELSTQGGSALGAVVVGGGGAGQCSPLSPVQPGADGVDSSIVVCGVTYSSSGGGGGNSGQAPPAGSVGRPGG